MHKAMLGSDLKRFFNHASFQLVLLLSFCAQAPASLSEEAYLDALKVAERKVQRTKPSGFSANALSSAIVQKMLGRQYRVGESWIVAAWHEEPAIARPFSRDGGSGGFNAQTGIFRYTVTSLNDAAEATIEVRQLKAFGLNQIDRRVEILTLQVKGSAIQSQKIYSDRIGTRLRVSPEGIHSRATPLELFPLDVPEIMTAEERVPGTFPTLPAGLSTIHTRAGAPLDLSRASWFEQDDFFGRPIQVLWQKGEPWPHYLRTPGGIAVLLGKVES